MAGRNPARLQPNHLCLGLLLAVLQSACGSEPGEAPCDTCNQPVSSQGGTGASSNSNVSAGEKASSGGQSGVATGGAATTSSGVGAGGNATGTGGAVTTSNSGNATGGLTSAGGTVVATGGNAQNGGTQATGGNAQNGGTQATGGNAQNGGTQAIGGSSTTQTFGDWPPSCTIVTGAVAAELVAEGALLVDVREPNEYSAGAVGGAINIPLGTISGRLAELDIDRPIVVYCRSGSRSKQAAAQLCDAGYSVYDMGAMSNWPE